MKQKKKILIGAIIVVIIAVLGIWADKAILKPYSAPGSGGDGAGSISGRTMSDVEANNGQDGKSCWVVVDKTIYEISGFAQWVDGMHTPSGGRARCGKDLSEVINQSPHGKSILSRLKEIGPLHQSGVNKVQ
jgi:predicted heme/steroid binding protein